MSKTLQIYKEAKKLIEQKPLVKQEPNGMYYSDMETWAWQKDFYLKTMLLVKEFDGVSGPLYLHLKGNRQQHDVNDAKYILNAMVQHMELFHADLLKE